MITGSVSQQREAIVTIDIVDSLGGVQPVEAVVDTGFTGSLTLQGKLVQDLELSAIGKRNASLADGSQVTLETYEARVIWHEKSKDIVVIEADGGPLIGMKLLEGSILSLHAKAGGKVEIVEAS